MICGTAGYIGAGTYSMRSRYGKSELPFDVENKLVRCVDLLQSPIAKVMMVHT
jgi:hypothetical protein